MYRSKEVRKAWWNSLTPEQQADYIEERQERGAKKKKRPEPKNEGVSLNTRISTREDWKFSILCGSKGHW